MRLGKAAMHRANASSPLQCQAAKRGSGSFAASICSTHALQAGNSSEAADRYMCIKECSSASRWRPLHADALARYICSDNPAFPVVQGC